MPFGTLRETADAPVTWPVLEPFSQIAAPGGVELTEIVPSARTATGTSRVKIHTETKRIVRFIR